MNISKSRKGKLHLTEEFMLGGECPRMLSELQATPIAVEYNYSMMYFQMLVISPLLPAIDPGAVSPLHEVEYDAANQTYKFKEL